MKPILYAVIFIVAFTECDSRVSKLESYNSTCDKLVNRIADCLGGRVPFITSCSSKTAESLLEINDCDELLEHIRNEF